MLSALKLWRVLSVVVAWCSTIHSITAHSDSVHSKHFVGVREVEFPAALIQYLADREPDALALLLLDVYGSNPLHPGSSKWRQIATYLNGTSTKMEAVDYQAWDMTLRDHELDFRGLLQRAKRRLATNVESFLYRSNSYHLGLNEAASEALTSLIYSRLREGDLEGRMKSLNRFLNRRTKYIRSFIEKEEQKDIRGVYWMMQIEANELRVLKPIYLGTDLDKAAKSFRRNASAEISMGRDRGLSLMIFSVRTVAAPESMYGIVQSYPSHQSPLEAIADMILDEAYGGRNLTREDLSGQIRQAIGPDTSICAHLFQ